MGYPLGEIGKDKRTKPDSSETVALLLTGSNKTFKEIRVFGRGNIVVTFKAIIDY